MASPIIWREVTLLCPDSGESIKIVVRKEEEERLDRDPQYARRVLELHREVVVPVEQQELPVLEELTQDIASTSPAGLDVYRWSHEATLLLIAELEKNQNKLTSPKFTNLAVFNMVGEVLRRYGYEVSNKQTETKWASLKRTYKRIKDMRGTSGEGAQKAWPYFEVMEEILGRRPEIKPISTADSDGLKEGSAGTSSSSPSSPKSPVKKRKLSQQQMFEKMMVDRTKRHKSKMERQDAMLALMQKLVEKNKKE